MPIYEYKCEECGAVFERLCRNYEDTGARCPDCNSEKCRRLISRVAASTSKPDACRICNVEPG